MRVNLLGLDAQALAGFVADIGEKPLRAKQLMRWVHRARESDFRVMSDLASALRDKLVETAVVEPPRLISDSVSEDGTRKWRYDVGNANAVETVFIPEPGRGTLCVSTQAGCTLACGFCSTGRQGFNRNLTSAEIIGQMWFASHALQARGAGASSHADTSRAQRAAAKEERIITNVVMMGMGEPLLNFDNVLPALRLMLDDHAYGLSRRRVTVSTAGIVPLIDRLREECPVALAVSLHAPNDDLRDRLMPINRKYPLRELLGACVRYLDRAPRDFVTFEYVMLAGVNDSPEHARQLAALVAGVPSKVNLIPFNSFPASGFARPSRETVRRFNEALNAAGIVTTTRRTRGEDIDAACGQLAGRIRDRTRRVVRLESAV